MKTIRSFGALTTRAMIMLLWVCLSAAHVDAEVRYVNLGNPSPALPYATWASAATNIQDAIDVALAGDEIVVTNGVYQTGGRVVDNSLTNRVAVTKPLTVRSLNGPGVTVIDGGGLMRCVYLGDGAVLVGFTLTNGAAYNGGGVWCESVSAVVSNCVLNGNSALTGGGAYGGTLNNCVLTGNSAYAGGGAFECTLNNCTLTGNEGYCGDPGSGGGGANNCTLNNCVLTGNSGDCSGGGAHASMLNNCTLDGNSANWGGGASSSTLINCTLIGNSASGSGRGHGGGGGASFCTLSNCVLKGNSTPRYGGGANGGSLNNCTLSDNSADEGGGAAECMLNNCTLTANSAGWGGGGAYGGDLNNCTLTGNSAGREGGGTSGGTLNNCTLTGNSATYYGGVGGPGHGGGASYGQLNNCTLRNNSAQVGGGAYQGTMNNCTLSGNSAVAGGGTYSGALNNCIVYFNIAGQSGDNYLGATFNYSCTTPLPPDGVGNITNEPAFVDLANGNLRLRPGSPCIDAGTNVSAIITNDLDGRPRPLDGDGDGIAAFDMGAFEYRALYVWQESPSSALPYGTWATAATNIQDAIDAALPGDEIVVTNGVYQTATGGSSDALVTVTKPLTVRSVNGPEATVIDGKSAAPCVYLSEAATLVGFTLTNGYGGGVSCASSAVASNCVISGNSADFGGGASGGTLNNCMLTGNSATYDGGGMYGGTLNNCTLNSNRAERRGGGAAYSALNNCVLNGNSATNRGGGGAAGSTLNNCILTGNSAADGGGAYGGTLNNCTVSANSASGVGGGASASSQFGRVNPVVLNNCTLTGNSAQYDGGGAWVGTLNNCTLTGNSAAHSGGGASGYYYNCCDVSGTVAVELNNCIVYHNVARVSGANYSYATFNYSCTTPLPSSGVGNFDNPPLFVDAANGNLRLQSNSPCINAGFNSSAPGGTDLDGNPRIVGGTVDVGAYEFQTPQSLISYAWLQQYDLPIDPSTDTSDPDGDQFNNWQEWRAGTDPTNAQSVLRLLTPTPLGPDLVLTWESVPGRSYFLEWSTNLGARPPFAPLASHLPADPFAATTTFTHTNAAGFGPWFYRVRVEE